MHDSKKQGHEKDNAYALFFGWFARREKMEQSHDENRYGNQKIDQISFDNDHSKNREHQWMPNGKNGNQKQ